MWQLVAAGTSEPGPVAWLGAAAVVVVVDLLGTALIAVAMAVDVGRRPRPAELLDEASPVVSLVNASAALVVVYVVTVDWRALWTVGVVVAVLFFALRAHNALRRRTESVEQLGQFTGEMGGQLDVDAAAQAAVAWMTRVLKADVVELTLTEEFAGRPRRWAARYDQAAAEVDGPGKAAALAAWLDAGPLLVPRRIRDRALLAALRSVGLRDAVAMPLQGDGGDPRRAAGRRPAR